MILDDEADKRSCETSDEEFLRRLTWKKYIGCRCRFLNTKH